MIRLLPDDQATEFRALWEEFEGRKTAEAQFAAALDRFEPVLQNANTDGHAWRKHGIPRGQVEAANRHIGDGSETVWDYVQELFELSEANGWFGRSPRSDA